MNGLIQIVCDLCHLIADQLILIEMSPSSTTAVIDIIDVSGALQYLLIWSASPGEVHQLIVRRTSSGHVIIELIRIYSFI